jgi:hypothetical protein
LLFYGVTRHRSGSHNSNAATIPRDLGIGWKWEDATCDDVCSIFYRPASGGPFVHYCWHLRKLCNCHFKRFYPRPRLIELSAKGRDLGVFGFERSRLGRAILW